MQVNGSGIITPGMGAHDYNYGTVVHIAASANPGWYFAGWTGGPVADPNSLATTVTVNSNKIVTANFTTTPTPAPTSSTPVTGITREVNGNFLPLVSITLDGIGPVVSDQAGQFQIMATGTGNHTVVAHKDGFRDRTQIVNIAGLGPGYAVTCNFQGQYGLIPNAPDMWYALDCVNLWLYPPNPDTGLDIWTALDVINAWQYPVH
jgi:hypothetical protein